MDLKIYNEGTILAPLKCGTRFMDGVFGKTNDGYTLTALKKNLFFPKIQTIIVRPPIEHISSAIHTEIINPFNNTERNPDEPIDVETIIDTFIWKNMNDNQQNTHWHRDLYETLYWTWRRNRDNIEIVELKNLSFYLKSIQIEIPEHKKEDYNFSNFKRYYCSTDELMIFIKNGYPEMWRNITNQIQHATKFYDYLINKEVIEVKLL